MSCSLTKGTLQRYLSSKATPPERQAVEQHIHDCEACRLEVEEFRKVGNVLGAVRLPVMSAAFWRHQKNRILSALPAPKPWMAPAYSLCLLLVVVAGYVFWGSDVFLVSVLHWFETLAARFGQNGLAGLTGFDTIFLLYGVLLALAVAVVFRGRRKRRRPARQARSS